MEYGILVYQRLLRIDQCIIGIASNPGRSFGKACVCALIPLHGSPGVVPSLGINGTHNLLFLIPFFHTFLIHIQQLDIPVFLNVKSDICHTQLFTLINVRGSLHSVDHGCQHFGGFHTVFFIISEVGYRAGKVVVIQEKAVPSLLIQRLLPFGKYFFEFHKGERRQIPFFLPGLLIQDHVFKLEYHGELRTVRVAVKKRSFRRSGPGLSHGHQIGPLECMAAHFPDKRMKHGAFRHDTVVRILADEIDNVQTEAAYAAVYPPVNHIINCLTQLRVFPVQVRLFYRELVKIILAAFRHPFPGRPAEGGFQIVGIFPLHAVTPDIKIVIRILPAFLCLQEPGMLVRAVVQYQIHDDADSSLFALRNQLVHVSQVSENRINILVIGNVIAIVVLRGAEYGRQPDSVNAKLLQIGKLPDNSLEIADAVCVAVVKASGINLINYRLLPPLCLLFFHNYFHPFRHAA